MSSEVARVLRDAADLIEPPGRWTRGAGARDEHGIPVPANDRQAVCWCGAGAIRHIAGSRHDLADEAMSYWRRRLGHWLIGSWNDEQDSAAPVVACLRSVADEVERRRD